MKPMAAFVGDVLYLGCSLEKNNARKGEWIICQPSYPPNCVAMFSKTASRSLLSSEIEHILKISASVRQMLPKLSTNAHMF